MNHMDDLYIDLYLAYVEKYIAAGRTYMAQISAVSAARWAFKIHPDLREVGQGMEEKA